MLAKRLREALYARAAERPIPLGNGMVLGERTVEGNDKLDGDIVWTVVRDLHGQEMADAAVERHATKSKLDAAIKAAGLKVAPTKRAVLAEVDARGGIERRQSTKVEVYAAALEAGQ